MMEMLPDPSLTVITCWDAELVGTVTRRLPESVTALTWYGVLPGGSTSVTFPDPLSTCTRSGTLVNVSAMSPDPGATGQVARACHAAGLVVLTCGTYGNVLRFLPPLVIGEDLLEEGLSILEDAFAAL